MKKAFIYGLATAILVLLTACGKSTAATIRLVKTEGAVHVSNDSEQDVDPQKNLLIYSGYGIDTASVSYAWMNLDDTKLAKMDEDSAIQIQKTRKDLEIQLEQGRLFFHVTEPLAEDETMNIRTSTMSVGIRGTCGWVTALDPEHMTLYLLEGTVECTAGKNTATATAGEMAVMTADGEITVTEFYQEDIPDFVWEELGKNTALEQAAEQLEKTGNAADSYDPADLDPESAVSNIRFAIDGYQPVLKWDVPANVESLTPSEGNSKLFYQVYLKEGNTWVLPISWSYEQGITSGYSIPWTSTSIFCPMHIAGVYSGVKIETVVSSLNSDGTYENTVVGVCEDLSLSLTVSRENGGLCSVDFEEETTNDEQSLYATVSGLVPDTHYVILFLNAGSNSGTSNSDGKSFPIAADNWIAEQCLIIEYPNITVSADGKTCSYTVLRHGDWQNFNLE